MTKTTSHPLCSTHLATLLNLPLFCSLNETLCKFQVTTVISVITIIALPITTSPPPQLDPCPTLPFPTVPPFFLPRPPIVHSFPPPPLIGPGFFSTVSNLSPPKLPHSPYPHDHRNQPRQAGIRLQNSHVFEYSVQMQSMYLNTVYKYSTHI